jgi:hypothetical protein
MSSIFIFDHEQEEGGSKINIDDLYEKRQKRDLKQLSIFNKILKRVHKRINHTAKNKNIQENSIWFQVPSYLVGEPIYDKGECIGYVVSQLEKNGFFVKYVHPNTLFISWHNWVPSYVRNEVKKRLGVVLDEKGNVIDQVEETDTNNPNNGLFNQQQENSDNKVIKNGKEYSSIKDYKPTGNLVYGEDMMNKLEKKISFKPGT